MNKTVIKRQNHVLEITDNFVNGWLNEEYLKRTEENEHLPTIRVSKYKLVGWVVDWCETLDGVPINEAAVISECLRDALSMTVADNE